MIYWKADSGIRSENWTMGKKRRKSALSYNGSQLYNGHWNYDVNDDYFHIEHQNFYSILI